MSVLRRLSTLAPLKPTRYGQPHNISHAHLLGQTELTPGLEPQEFAQRRKRLMDSLPDNSVVVAVSAPVKYMSKNIFYKYRQASDFWYLTGFQEPESAVVLEKNSSSKGYKMSVFCPGTDPAKEKWEGPRTSFPDVCDVFAADAAHPITTFPSQLKSILPSYSDVYVDLPPSSTPRTRRSSTPSVSTSKSLMHYLGGTSARTEYDTIVDTLTSSRRHPLAPQVGKLRAIKSPAEQRIMRAAADISGLAHAKTMCFTEPGISEHAIAAHFQYLCQRDGAQRLAYVPVVASGPNALIIHYTNNNQIAKDGEMILMDAGCEYNGYASDITRTYPVNGRFTPAQRDLYSALLSVQKALIPLCTQSSNNSLHALHRQSASLLRIALTNIGFTFPSNQKCAEEVIDRILYPHFLSHPIGIDLHESSDGAERNVALQEGMVVTIEPGVYVPADDAFPKCYHGIGIRIEDEVLVGDQHPVVLSAAAPKEIEDIEGACQGVLGLQPY